MSRDLGLCLVSALATAEVLNVSSHIACLWTGTPCDLQR